MKLICDGLDLSDAVIKVSKAINAKTTNPILEGIKLVAEDGTLTLSATDSELAIEKKIKADTIVEGETVVPGRFFSDFVKKLTNEKIELNLNEKNQLKISYCDSEGFFQCMKTEEYPSFKTIDSGEFFGICQKDFKNMINKTIFSVAQDDSRPILKGCLLEIENNYIYAVALDGYRLALCKKELASCTSKKLSIIVPARSLNEVGKLLEDSDDIINIYVQKNYLMIDLKNTKIITRLIDGEYLNYKQIIANEFSSSIKVNVNQFANALERASLLSKVGQNNLVKFDIKEKNMIVTSNSEIGNIKENININLVGKELNIAFNAMYFLDALRTINDEFVEIKFNSPINPCIIKSIENDKFIYLILPVRMIN
ncbi:MAG: DNA polymerase III subunit beta [Clostridia bacterium]